MRKVLNYTIGVLTLLSLLSCRMSEHMQEDHVSIEHIFNNGSYDIECDVVRVLSPEEVDAINDEERFSEMNVIEKITFVQEGDIKVTACLVEHEGSLYTIEVFYSDTDETQSLRLGRWERAPTNLRAFDATPGREGLDIVIRSRVFRDSSVAIDDESWDTIFDWIGPVHRFAINSGPPTRTSSTELTNADGTALIASIVVLDNYFNYKIEILDSEFNNIQNIVFYTTELPSVQWLTSLGAVDLNGDGYSDLLTYAYEVNTTVSARWLTYQMYVWDVVLQRFEEVEFIGFDFLMWPEYQDGYVINYIRNFNIHTSIVQTLTWEGNNLVKISEERHVSY